jgi:selenide, water dikinase
MLPEGTADWQRQLYCDPQTSGGLLIPCEANEADATLDMIVARVFPQRGSSAR